jgi:hypothetical protein
MSKSVGMAGAIMSDLVAGLHALVTEHLAIRIRQLNASADAFKLAIERIKQERS